MSLQEEDNQERVIIDQEWIEELEGALAWFCLIGKSLAKKQPNLEALKAVMSKVWNVESGFQVKEFNKALLALNEYDGFQSPESVQFEVCPFWLCIYGLPLNMMNEKIGIAVGETVGPVLEFDEDWGRYLRVRVQMNFCQSLKAGTLVSAPNEELYVDFRFEKLLDYCWVCGLLDHLDNDFPVTVSLRKNHQIVKKKYTCNLKAEFPPVTPAKEPASSHRRGGSAASVSPVLRAGREVGNIGPAGSRSVPSKSINGGGPVRNHADSPALYGRRAARALQFDEASCEIIYRMNGNLVRQQPNLKEGQGQSQQRGNGGKVVAGLSVDSARRGILSKMGATLKENLLVEGEGEFRGVAAVNDVDSSNNSQYPDDYIPLIDNMGCGSFIGAEIIGAQSIPGVGLSSIGPTSGAVRSKSMGLQAELQRRANAKSGSTGATRQQRANNVQQGDEPYDPDAPYVFCAEASEGTKIRKWKKTAHTAQSASVDLLFHETMRSVGAADLREDEADSGNMKHRSSNQMEWIKVRLGYHCCFVVDSRGRLGGLALLWMANDCISLLSYSFYHIDVAIGSDMATQWRFTGFYGRPETSRRHESWSLLRNLGDQYSLPWLCAGDFNELKSNLEKEGGSVRSPRQMELFNEVIGDCNFRELPVQGLLMTSCRNKNGELLFERLDRSMANPAWWDRFGYSIEKHLSYRGDACPLRGEIYCRSRKSNKQYSKCQARKLEARMDYHLRFFSVVGNDVTDFVLDFLNNGSPLSNVNHTNIVLIPKLDSPRFAKDYRPISLCNVIFKIVSKVLANRLKDILPELIGENQSAFVPKRMIYDNAMIAFETIHFMRNKRRGRKHHMALKLDLSKAYDLVEWGFLRDSMRAMGFPDRWISLVMECVETVSYSVLVNDKQGETFHPTRGIRQGDPLSPYLFLLCMEGPSSMFSSGSRSGFIHGISISRSAPKVSHLFFADDSILFLQASRKECEAMISLLNLFEAASGQKINIDKSSILFSANTPLAIQNKVMSYLGIQRNPDTLCTRVLRAKYYPRGDFLHATLESSPSFLWRSLMAGRRVIIAGSRFRVGEGNLDIWKDRWIAKPPSFRPSPRIETVVPDLKEDASRILGLAIPRHPVRDCLIWNATRMGEFSVKSAYYVARDVLRRADSLQGPRQQTWKLVWSSQIMPKIHFFTWRLIWNILPTKGNLVFRGLDVPQLCEVCGKQPESVFHVFFRCKFSELVWDRVGPCVNLTLDQWNSDGDWWDFFIAKATSIGQLDKVLITLWLIWNNRNKALYEQLTWIPPPMGIVKINTDVAFCSSSGEAGLGVVIRDSAGKIIICASRCLNFIADSLYAEVHALLFGFELAIEHGIERCIFESDSLLPITQINKKDPIFWEGGHLIEEIRDLATLFDDYTFQFVHREANILAHNLANLWQDCVWCGTIPPGVL
ncbi:reverse transcriptase [Corchorus capsularis]|uniref:Reverse transcriptase n=1 Tax=Corchorus capsularis TaxID=210143 RepID=A0A1R3G1P9_COCAP|nr:reverse transcriptase [Corchorus capsularis]